MRLILVIDYITGTRRIGWPLTKRASKAVGGRGRAPVGGKMNILHMELYISDW